MVQILNRDWRKIMFWTKDNMKKANEIFKTKLPILPIGNFDISELSIIHNLQIEQGCVKA